MLPIAQINAEHLMRDSLQGADARDPVRPYPKARKRWLAWIHR
jgi:hypothetical protein